jgi:hypothetical protein
MKVVSKAACDPENCSKSGHNMQLYIPDKIISEIGKVAGTEILKRLSEQSLDLVSLFERWKSLLPTARHDFAALSEKSIRIIFCLKFAKLSSPMFSLNRAYKFEFSFIDGLLK